MNKMIGLVLLVAGMSLEVPPKVDLSQRSFVLVTSGADYRMTRDELVVLFSERRERFDRDYVWVQGSGEATDVVISKKVMGLGFMESVLDDIASGRTRTVGRSTVVLWSQRTANFVKEGGVPAFPAAVQLLAREGFPMVLTMHTRAHIGDEMLVLEGSNQLSEEMRFLEEYARSLPRLDPREVNGLERNPGLRIDFGTSVFTSDEEQEQLALTMRVLQREILRSRKEWFDGIEPLLRLQREQDPLLRSLPKGSVELGSLSEELRNTIESQLSKRTRGGIALYPVVSPALRVQFQSLTGVVVTTGPSSIVFTGLPYD